MDESDRQIRAEIKNTPVLDIELLPQRRRRGILYVLFGFAFSLLLVVVLLMLYPFDDSSPFQRMLARRELERNERLWYSQNISSYEYKLSYVGGGEMTMRVENGRNIMEKSSYLSDEAGIFFTLRNAGTVPRLFDSIGHTIGTARFLSNQSRWADSADSGVHELRVTYDPKLGYPTDIFIDLGPPVSHGISHLRITEFGIIRK